VIASRTRGSEKGGGGEDTSFAIFA